MKLRVWRLLALSSALVAALLNAATRPRYGGDLRVQLIESAPVFFPSQPKSWPLVHLVFETLVRIDQQGNPRLQLASGWQHDADFKRWQITLRPEVTFHDGTPLNTGDAQSSLAEALTDARVSASESGLLIESQSPRPNLLQELAAPRMAIVRRTAQGTLAGTGPFQLKDLSTLVANQAHWNGRPFLDSVVFSAAGAADVIEVTAGATRRLIPERMNVWTSAPRELFAIQILDAEPVIREALSASIDRAAIANVLTLGRGVPTGALLPQWMSGYAFLFRVKRDLASARQSLAGTRLAPLTLTYSSADPSAKAIAERVAVNARDAGISIQVSPLASNPNLRLARVRVESLDQLGSEFGLGAAAGSLYERERGMLDSARIIPLLHVPDVFALHPRVHGWDQAHAVRDGRLHLENVWIEP